MATNTTPHPTTSDPAGTATPEPDRNAQQGLLSWLTDEQHKRSNAVLIINSQI